MSIRKLTVLCFVIVFLMVNVQKAVFASEQQKRIVVLPFSFHNATDDAGDVDVGSEIAKVLSAKNAKIPGWSTCDYDDVLALLKRDDTADFGAAQIGRALNADAVITGSVQSFEFQSGSENAAVAADVAQSAAYTGSSYIPKIGNFAGLIGAVPLPAVIADRGRAKVDFEVKLMDVCSGKEITTLTGTSESRKRSSDFWGEGGPNSDFLSSTFANCIAGQATFSAVDSVCKQLEAFASQIDALVAKRVQGTITDVDDDLICVSVGKENGYKIGDKFIVERDSPSQSDENLVRVGVIAITDVGDQAALTKLIDGTVPVPGDTIRNQ